MIQISVLKTGIANVVSDSHRYQTDKGIISMLHPCRATFNSYEIYCVEGSLFEDIERYETLEQAEQRIEELLTTTFTLTTENGRVLINGLQYRELPPDTQREFNEVIGKIKVSMVANPVWN